MSPEKGVDKDCHTSRECSKLIPHDFLVRIFATEESEESRGSYNRSSGARTRNGTLYFVLWTMVFCDPIPRMNEGGPSERYALEATYDPPVLGPAKKGFLNVAPYPVYMMNRPGT